MPRQWRCLTGAMLVGLALAGCTHARLGSVDQHYADFKSREPNGNTVHVCHAYGCKMQTRFKFTEPDIATLSEIMRKSRHGDAASDERRAIAYAIGWMEKRTGDVIGTNADRPGTDFAGSGDPTQQDCVDEATNTTSYMLVLQHNKLLKHHTVGTPFSKENPLRGTSGWPHWTAVLVETTSGQKWAVDSWINANGENPAVVEAELWARSLNSQPQAMR